MRATAGGLVSAASGMGALRAAAPSEGRPGAVRTPVDGRVSIADGRAGSMQSSAGLRATTAGRETGGSAAAVERPAKGNEQAALMQAALTKPELRNKEQVDCLVEFLWASHMLKTLQPSIIRAIAQGLRGQVIKEGETVYSKGDEAKHFFLVAIGIVSMLDTDDDDDASEIEMRRLGAYDCFGEHELLEGLPRCQTARCLGLVAPPVAGATAAAPTIAAPAPAPGPDDLLLGAQPLLLVLTHEDYKNTLERTHRRLLEEKVSFLRALPILKNLTAQHLQDLAHCFHERDFDAKVLMVHQGDWADCMYIIKSGQVCIMIDPKYKAPTARSRRVQAAESDPNKLVQVCMLGSGAVIGDVLLRQEAGSRRTATAIALTDLVAYRVQIVEFKRHTPADVLESMRQVAGQKLANDVNIRAHNTAVDTAVTEGFVTLGERVVPEAVLQGRWLRVLTDESYGRSLLPASSHSADSTGLGSRNGSRHELWSITTGGTRSSSVDRSRGTQRRPPTKGSSLQQLLSTWSCSGATQATGRNTSPRDGGSRLNQEGGKQASRLVTPCSSSLAASLRTAAPGASVGASPRSVGQGSSPFGSPRPAGSSDFSLPAIGRHNEPGGSDGSGSYSPMQLRAKSGPLFKSSTLHTQH